MVVIQGVAEGREKKERRDYGMGATVWDIRYTEEKD